MMEEYLLLADGAILGSRYFRDRVRVRDIRKIWKWNVREIVETTKTVTQSRLRAKPTEARMLELLTQREAHTERW